MPAPTNPPYSAGAIMQPRMLNRWLDVNKVSPLTRIGSYFTIPTFTVNSNWRNYSELVAVFDYASQKNFSIKNSLTTLPTNPNYLACISYANSDGTGTRYKLWENVGEKFFFDIPLYTGQKIKKNFRIEIWSVYNDTTDFSISGAGTTVANTTFHQTITFPNYFTSDIANTILIIDDPLIWDLQTSGLSISRYTLSKLDRPVASFPFGTGWVITGGVAPAPVEIVMANVSSQANVITVYTSIKGAYDYRYQSDYLISTIPTINSNLSLAFPLNIPIVFPSLMTLN